MVVEQFEFNEINDIDKLSEMCTLVESNLILMFGSKEFICNKDIFDKIRGYYKTAYIIGCSTAGEVYNDQVHDNVLTVTAIKFKKTEVKFFQSKIFDSKKCYKQGMKIANSIPKENLSHLFVLTEGMNINGSKFIEGLVDGLPEEVKITGGLAADDDRFLETFVIANDYAEENSIAVIAFYGENIKIGYGSVGGWNTFGVERKITKANENILYELDGKPALDLYVEYLGEYAKDLPASGLFFPLNIRSDDNKFNVVRTVSSIDEKERSLKYVGEIPKEYHARLMRANFNNLINGAAKAAENCIKSISYNKPQLGIIVSCFGRKFVLNQMCDEEIEVVRNIFGKDVILTGFYSYGEIAPSNKDSVTEFHNQTMTITLIGEEE
ncbi:FIST signal transduction protein [Clostridium saccharoperbutylacetonicum]|uniref:FIST signal transduction protein n=1 Tax=Clostridium saccharoperbutylacetonicum TaxID=36745 RepID=UPI000983F28F|nr:FIST N-terminal domain-containing protein [Clostridium saccharoperbutylacetonicum]AQR94944.1 FIST N domain protein [Clostridium saccharoperbutylacetonicum]NSB30787.1 hypothetical protein [Clostridium saccharoperbutylacetonicum]